MLKSASPYIPPTANLEELAAASKKCRGCDLYQHATQTVFGEGPQNARVMMLGEQPGNKEDQIGRPFVGPSGHLLDKALADAGLHRQEIYVSNAVKHFKFKLKGTLRFHQKPTETEIRACRPWLEKEFKLIKPDVIVCLGASAAESLLGRKITIRDARGHFIPHPYGNKLLVTVHPSSILRIPDDHVRHQEYRHFVRDLMIVRQAVVK